MWFGIGVLPSMLQSVLPNPNVARDGKRLIDQPAQTQAMFRASWGDHADQEWATEHNASLPAVLPTATPDPWSTSNTDVAIACEESIKQGLQRKGVPGDEISVDHSQTQITRILTAGQPAWECSMAVEAPNIYGAKRVATYTTTVSNIHEDSQGLHWTTTTQ
jgi:hypothetical protein